MLRPRVTGSTSAGDDTLPLTTHSVSTKRKKRRPKRRSKSSPTVTIAAIGCICVIVVLMMMSAFTGQTTSNTETSADIRRKIESLPSDSIYRLTAPDINLTPVDLSQFAGRPSLVINVASQ
mmetsp:Transcript_10001/g.14026  ORF Transcript_10001/g.14026 Transcript_10001/m.14026 type:complete len:121 (-) Transcript_10001:61-423(-)